MTTRDVRAVVELAASQHGVCTRAQAAQRGLDHDRLRTLLRDGVFDEPLPMVLRPVGAPETWHQRLMVGCLAHRAVASHRAAVRLHAIDDRRALPVVEGLVLRGFQRAATGMVLHRAKALDRRDVTRVDGIPVTSLARSLCDLGAVASMAVVEQALDEALRRGASLRWIEATLHRLDRPGPSGTGVLRRVLELPDRQGVIPDSWRERVTERLLAHPDLPPLVRQLEIRAADGAVIARPDLAVPSVRLGIEFHSDQWHFGPRRGRGDRRRDLAVARVGWELVYLDQTDHDEARAAVEAVLDVVAVRQQRLRGA